MILTFFLIRQVKYMRILDGGLSQELIDVAKTIGGKPDKPSDSVETMYHAFMYLEKLCERKLSQYPATLQVRLLTLGSVSLNIETFSYSYHDTSARGLIQIWK